MGLLTQLIADHHDTETRNKAAQVGIWKGILEDQRAPEDGGFTSEMKNHALEQMVGMANGGKPGAQGGGKKGKAGEMLGVFQHLLGLGGGDSGGNSSVQDAAAATGMGMGSGSGSGDGPKPPPIMPDDPGAPSPDGAPAAPVAAPVPVAAPRPLQRSPNGLPAPFMTDAEKLAMKDTRFDQETGRQVRRATALDAAKDTQDRSQVDTAARMKLEGVQSLVGKMLANDPTMSKKDAQATAEAIYGIKIPTPAHKTGATDKFVKDGKSFIRTYYTDGTSVDEADVTAQPTGSNNGLTGGAKNQLWARQHQNSADPIEAMTAKGILDEVENTRLSKDLLFKTNSLKLSNLRNATDPSSITAIANGVKNGTVDPTLVNMSRATATLVTKKLAEEGFNNASAKIEYDSTKSYYRALNSPQQVRMRQNVEQTKESLPLVFDAGEAWKAAMVASGKNPILNSVELGAAKQGVYGKDAQAAAVVLEGQIADVVSELAGVYMGSASPTDKAIELASKSLKANWSWDTLQAQLKQVDKNLDRRQSAITHLTVMGAGDDSTYIPRDDAGTPNTPKLGVAAPTPAPAVVPAWQVQARTKPVGNIITLPNGAQVKKTGDDKFEVVKAAPSVKK